MAQALGFVCSLDQFILHGNRECQSFWSYTLCQQRSNRSIQVSSRNALTRRLSSLNAFVLAEIIGHNTLTSSLVVSHRHAFSTLTAEDDSLQERWSFPWRREALGSIGLTIHGQLCLISLVILP